MCSYLKCIVYDKLLKPPTIISNNPVYINPKKLMAGIFRWPVSLKLEWIKSVPNPYATICVKSGREDFV